jgi:hypothetical protein
MNKPKAVTWHEGDYQCVFCGDVNGGHNVACPTTDDDMEVWSAGADAARDGSECFGEIGGTFWLGWVMQTYRRIAAEG